MRTATWLVLFCMSTTAWCAELPFGGIWVGGRSADDVRGIGGFGPSDNAWVDPPADITAPAIGAGLSLVILNDPPPKQLRVWLINRSPDARWFAASDSRLYAVQQVLHQDVWRDAEQLQGSWCGNSRHDIRLPAGKAWSSTLRRREGGVATSYRLKLSIDRAGGTVIHSDPWLGSYDPAWFAGPAQAP